MTFEMAFSILSGLVNGNLGGIFGCHLDREIAYHKPNPNHDEQDAHYWNKLHHFSSPFLSFYAPMWIFNVVNTAKAKLRTQAKDKPVSSSTFKR